MNIFERTYIFAAENIDTKSLPHVTADSNEIQKIFSVALTITAGISLLIITISGMRYIAAKGDPSAIAQARMTILYALVGLIVSASAFAIVNLALSGL